MVGLTIISLVSYLPGDGWVEVHTSVCKLRLNAPESLAEMHVRNRNPSLSVGETELADC